MSSKELVETALHVLVAWTQGQEPIPSHVELLRQAFPASAHLPVDDLACQVVHDLSGRMLPEPERKDIHRKKKDVA